MACRSGCPTRDHASWGACARDAHIAVQWLGGTGMSLGTEKAYNAEIDRYDQAIKDGLEPNGVDTAAVTAAYAAAEG